MKVGELFGGRLPVALEIPRPAGENAGLRDDAETLSEGYVATFDVLNSVGGGTPALRFEALTFEALHLAMRYDIAG